MPIYLYKCSECKVVEEKLMKISDSEKPVLCPKCCGDMHREFDMSGGGFQLKGNWFSTKGRY